MGKLLNSCDPKLQFSFASTSSHESYHLCICYYLFLSTEFDGKPLSDPNLRNIIEISIWEIIVVEKMANNPFSWAMSQEKWAHALSCFYFTCNKTIWSSMFHTFNLSTLFMTNIHRILLTQNFVTQIWTFVILLLCVWHKIL